MGTLVYSMGVSLDGFIAGPHGEIDWSAPDEELHRFHNEQMRELDAHLCGRRLYEVMTYWETIDERSSVPEHELEFARIWKDLPKIVFSKTLERVEGNARLVRDGVAEEVARLKERPGGDLAVGAGLASTLLKLGLVDEYRLFVSPVLLGGGTPYFPGPGGEDEPGAGRDTDVWLSRRLRSLPACVREPVGLVLACALVVAPRLEKYEVEPRPACAHESETTARSLARTAQRGRRSAYARAAHPGRRGRACHHGGAA